MTASPLSIVHVVRQFHPGIGGMEECVLQLARYQQRDGHRVRVVTLDTIFDDDATGRLPHRDAIDGIEIRRVGWTGSKRYPVAPGVLRHLDGADIVHVHGVDFLFDYLALTWPLHRRRLVLSTHGGFFHTQFAGKMKLRYFATVTCTAIRAYAGTGASSTADYDRFRQIAPRNLRLIENGVSLDKFRGLADPSARSMLYFGRLAPNKGLFDLLPWFAAARSVDPAWRLVIAGKPMGVEAGELRARAAAAGVADAVEIVVTPTDAEIADIVRRSSVYVSASSYEGFGLAAIEGASAHLYPVLNAIPAFERTIETMGFGRIVDFADPASGATFARDWPKIARPDPDALDRLLDARFGWRGHVDAFYDLYRAARK
jgi:alpha-1,3-mannosyltransferase